MHGELESCTTTSFFCCCCCNMLDKFCPLDLRPAGFCFNQVPEQILGSTLCVFDRNLVLPSNMLAPCLHALFFFFAFLSLCLDLVEWSFGLSVFFFYVVREFVSSFVSLFYVVRESGRHR